MVIPRKGWPQYDLLSLTCARKMGNIIPTSMLARHNDNNKK